jgi:GT2 family glycosyltransferase
MRVLDQAHGGPAAARNLGVARAAAPLILFLDDDVVPAPELIEMHVSAHAHHGLDAVVIGPMSPPHGWRRPAWIRWEEEKLELQYASLRSGKWACTARQFYTGNSSVGRELFLAAGGFDSSFKRAEDVELGYRLRDLGARFVFTPAADVTHYASRTYAAWCRTPYQYGRYDVVMARDKGHESLRLALREFRWRHPLNRLLPRVVTGRQPLLRTLVVGLGWLARAAGACGADGASLRALSGVFNLLYWQGVCDEVGGAAALWRCVAAGDLVAAA